MTTTRNIDLGGMKFEFAYGTDTYGCRTWSYGGYTIVERASREFMVTNDSAAHGYVVTKTLKAAAGQVLAFRSEDVAA